MKYLRGAMTGMMKHGVTTAYIQYARCFTMLLLSALYSKSENIGKDIYFQETYNNIHYYIIKGAINRLPLPYDFDINFSQSILISIDKNSIFSEFLIFNAHVDRFHTLNKYSERVLLALQNVYIEGALTKMKGIQCGLCNRRKASSGQKQASINPSKEAISDYISTISRFDNEAIVDYMIIDSLQGLRYILIVILKNSLFTLHKVMEGYDSKNLLIALLQLHCDLGVNIFHADHGSQIVAIATHISALSQNDRMKLLENESMPDFKNSNFARFFKSRDGLIFPNIIIKVHLAKRHQAIGLCEARQNLIKITLRKFEILYGNRDIENNELSLILSVAIKYINELPTFTYRQKILAPSDIKRIYNSAQIGNYEFPESYKKKFPDIVHFFEEARTNIILTIVESKLHLFSNQSNQSQDKRVRGYLLTPGCVVLDLVSVKEKKSIRGALSRLIAKTQTQTGAIIYRKGENGQVFILTRQFEDLAFISGKLLQFEDNVPKYKMFSLPDLCNDALQQVQTGENVGSLDEALSHYNDLPENIKMQLGKDNIEKLGRGQRRKYVNRRYVHYIFK